MTIKEIWSRVVVVYAACLLASAGGFSWLIGSIERNVGKHMLFALILWFIVDQWYRPKSEDKDTPADEKAKESGSPAEPKGK